MAVNELQVVATELEHVDEVLPMLFEREDKFFARIEKRPVIKVSNRAMRIPLELRPGGDFAHFDPDGGDLGQGDGPTYDVATLQPVHLRQAIQWTKKAEWATDDRRKAIIDLVRQLTTKSMQEFRRNLDSMCMRDGTGTLGTVTSFSTTAITNDTWLLNTDGFNARLIRYGMRLNIYDPTLTIQRTNPGNLPKVIYYDLPNKIIRVDQTVQGLTAGDLIVVAGLAGPNPTSVFGVQYHHSNASTGTWLGFNRATTPEVRANRVAANGSFVLPLARLAINKVGDRVGENTVRKVQAWMHPCQKQQYESVGQLVSIIHKQPREEALDMYFGDNMQMAGAPVQTHFSWDKTRIDFIYQETWGRAEMHPAKFYDVDGRKIFELRGASGGVATSQVFYLTISWQLFVRNPAACVYIDTLTIPSGY
jgi:hypothetical protein